jgi:hypothetical protein
MWLAELLIVVALSSFAALAAGCSERSEPTGSLRLPTRHCPGAADDRPARRAAQRIVALDAGSAELVDARRGDRLVGVPAGVTQWKTRSQAVRLTGQVDVGAKRTASARSRRRDARYLTVSRSRRSSGAPKPRLHPAVRSVGRPARVIELGYCVGERALLAGS